MKLRTVHYFLMLPLAALLLLMFSRHEEYFIVWGMLYIALLPVYGLVSLIMICLQEHRKNGLHLLLGTGILALVGFCVCSSGIIG